MKPHFVLTVMIVSATGILIVSSRSPDSVVIQIADSSNNMEQLSIENAKISLKTPNWVIQETFGVALQPDKEFQDIVVEKQVRGFERVQLRPGTLEVLESQFQNDAIVLVRHKDGWHSVVAGVIPQKQKLQILDQLGSPSLVSIQQLIRFGFQEFLVGAKMPESLAGCEMGVLGLDKLRSNVGLCETGSTKVVSFLVTNYSRNEIEFEFAKSSCGCLSIFPSEPHAIAPGKSNEYRITIETGNKSVFSNRILFSFCKESESNKAARFFFRIIGNNDVPFRTSPSSIDFGAVQQQGHPVNRQIRFLDVTDDEVKSFEYRIDGDPDFSATKIARSGRTVLQIGFSPTIPGHHEAVVRILAGQGKKVLLAVPVKAEVKPEDLVQPKNFAFSRVVYGEKKFGEFELLGAIGSSATVKCTNDAVTLEKISNRGYRFSFEVTGIGFSTSQYTFEAREQSGRVHQFHIVVSMYVVSSK